MSEDQCPRRALIKISDLPYPLPSPVRVTNAGGVVPTPWDELARLARDRRTLFLVVQITRPGATLFLADLEYTHFSPKTARNALFSLAVADWEELRWVIAWVPVSDRALAVQSADRCGMRLANGVPHIVSAGARPGPPRVAVFPLSTRNVWTVENRRDSILYQPGGATDLREEEAFRVREIFKKGAV